MAGFSIPHREFQELVSWSLVLRPCALMLSVLTGLTRPIIKTSQGQELRLLRALKQGSCCCFWLLISFATPLGPPVLPLLLPVSSPAHTADAASQSSPLHLFLSGVLSLCLQLLKSLLPPFSLLYLLSNLQAINLSPGIRAALPSPRWDTSTTTRGYESRGAL